MAARKNYTPPPMPPSKRIGPLQVDLSKAKDARRYGFVVGGSLAATQQTLEVLIKATLPVLGADGKPEYERRLIDKITIGPNGEDVLTREPSLVPKVHTASRVFTFRTDGPGRKAGFIHMREMPREMAEVIAAACPDLDIREGVELDAMGNVTDASYHAAKQVKPTKDTQPVTNAAENPLARLLPKHRSGVPESVGV